MQKYFTLSVTLIISIVQLYGQKSDLWTKDKAAIDQFGTLAQHGVILIELKPGILGDMPDELAEKFKRY